jgi:hypothetical protein
MWSLFNAQAGNLWRKVLAESRDICRPIAAIQTTAPVKCGQPIEDGEWRMLGQLLPNAHSVLERQQFQGRYLKPVSQQST